ncbi:MAG: HEAT repeat domain-containing protein [Candidatus Stahlbacteria bacterium]|nr:HEAT repeat domain-containing protein [Candidatus Stahlbacteria bacterium]
MKRLFFILCLSLPVLAFGDKMKEIRYDEMELAKYKHDLKQGIPQKRWEAAEIMGDAGNCKFVPDLITALNDEVPKVRMYVAEALGKLCDNKSRGPLRKVLDDPYPMVRYAVAEALSRLKDPAGLPICVQALRDINTDWRRRARIAEALGILNDPGAITALISVLGDTASAKVREEASYSLGKMGAEAAVPHLCNRLDHTTEDMPLCRIAAATALAQIGDKPGAIPCLAFTLDDPDNEVRNAVSEALRTLIDEDNNVIPIIIELLEPDETRPFAETALDSFFNVKKDIPLLSKVVGSGKRGARLYAIRRLEEVHESSAQFPLVEALEDPDSIVRARAAQGLGKLGFCDPAAVQALLEFVDDSTTMVAKSAIISLGQLGDPRADTTLYRIMKESRKFWEIRIVAAQACGGLPADAIYDQIFLFSRHADWQIRYLACVTMGARLDKRTEKTLEYIAHNDEKEDVKESARTALANLQQKDYKRTYGTTKPK